jgi:hypothetical protein
VVPEGLRPAHHTGAALVTNSCVRCGRPTPDGYACSPCSGIAGKQLASIAELTSAARDVAHGQSRRGPTIAGTNEHGIELNLSAQERLDQIENELWTSAREVAEERYGTVWAPAVDPLAEAARWLAGQVEWKRHREDVDEFMALVDASARLLYGIIDGAPPRVYLGPCAGYIETDPTAACPVNCTCHNGPHYECSEPGGCGSAGCGRGEVRECTGDVYGRQGHDTARCRSCGAEVDVADRKAWLDETVRETLFRAVYIADAYSINVNTIRSWYARGRLASHGEEDGKPTFRVGEVLDLAAADALRRAENEAKKARRQEAA